MAKVTISYPTTGLTVSISIKDRLTGVEDFSGVMTEVSKVYKYDFSEVADTDYIYIATCTGYDDMTGVLYAESISGGLSTEEHDKLMSLSTGGGGGGFSSQAIQTSISNAKREIIEKIGEIPKTDMTNIETQLNDIDSHIELAKDDVIDTIKASETEICSDVIRKSKEIKEDNVKTRNLVRQKTEKIDQNVSKLSDRQDLTDKTIEREADSIEEELEGIYNMECDMIENEIFNKEADDIEESMRTSK